MKLLLLLKIEMLKNNFQCGTTTIQNTSNKNSLKWDLLVWGDDDWYYENPWTVFFILCISIFILGYKTILNNSTVAYTDAIVQTKEVKLEVFLNI